MYPTAGLEFWEFVVASGICAMAALLIASIISVAFTYFVMREPTHVSVQAPVRGQVPEPVSSGAGRPSLATG
jgi:hypothetical protein